MASEKTSLPKKLNGKPPCMILCAGTSKRFGSNKMLAHLAGIPLLKHTIDRVRPQVSGLALNGDGAKYDSFGLCVFPDTIGGKLGPLVGILTAMEWADELGHERVLTVSGDTPFIPNDLAATLSQTPKNTIALPQVEGRSHQICGLWPTGLAKSLRAFLRVGESYSVRDFLKQHENINVAFSKQKGINSFFVDPFFNINTKEEMAQAERVFMRIKPS